jgi:hypothetical protein
LWGHECFFVFVCSFPLLPPPFSHVDVLPEILTL